MKKTVNSMLFFLTGALVVCDCSGMGAGIEKFLFKPLASDGGHNTMRTVGDNTIQNNELLTGINSAHINGVHTEIIPSNQNTENQGTPTNVLENQDPNGQNSKIEIIPSKQDTGQQDMLAKEMDIKKQTVVAEYNKMMGEIELLINADKIDSNVVSKKFADVYNCLVDIDDATKYKTLLRALYKNHEKINDSDKYYCVMNAIVGDEDDLTMACFSPSMKKSVIKLLNAKCSNGKQNYLSLFTGNYKRNDIQNKIEEFKKKLLTLK